MYLFPVKALAQDQLRALSELTAPLPSRPPAATYDGDTPQHERAAIRKNARLLLTNPEMLHVGILPNHRLWSRFLRRLRFVVIDEGHMYRGVFGSHVAMLVRRLRRICRRYGANPQFIVTSATLGNPKEHAEGLTGLPMTAITEDGAPTAGREFALWNPPIIDDATGARRSVLAEGAELFSWLVSTGTRTLSFVRTRQAAELMYRISEENLQRYGTADARVSSYRAGYVPEERREIEAKLSSGELTGVVTTNALELGIDIGHLDATVINGYPGSLAATFQQSGRSGGSVGCPSWCCTTTRWSSTWRGTRTSCSGGGWSTRAFPRRIRASSIRTWCARRLRRPSARFRGTRSCSGAARLCRRRWSG